MKEPQFKKGDRVVCSRDGKFLQEGIILDWTYRREDDKFNYLVGTTDFKRRMYFDEDNVKPSEEEDVISTHHQP